jgi:predicted nucleic acid-binding protein
MNVFVDSDILIEISRARDQEILRVWTALADTASEIYYSPVSEAEVWAGARPNEYAATTALLQRLTCVDITRNTGRKAGEYMSRFGKSHGVEVADALIAAGAFDLGATLWTRNRKHYPMPDITFF